MGKNIPNPNDRKNTLVREIHFDTLFNILRETDWAKCPLYQIYKVHGRWKHLNPNIYSEIELKYLHSSLTSMVRDEKDANYNEFDQNEGLAIINKHWMKTMATLEYLMNLMNMMYYF